MTDKTIIEWKEKLRIMMANFAMYIGNDTGSENDNHEAEIAKFEFFISEQLTLAEEKGREKERKFIGKNKRVWFNKGVKEGEEKARGEIITKLKQKKFTDKEINTASKHRQHSMIFFNGFLEAAISSLQPSQDIAEEDCHCHGACCANDIDKKCQHKDCYGCK